VNDPRATPEADRAARRRRSDGERSRNAILDTAARLATVEGIAGLSIGRLAEEVGMSKSGLFAHFGSKEELQLATVDTAAAIFAEQVVEPAEGGARRDRLRLLVDAYLRYVERDTFPGGCFFASALAELSMQPGPVRDSLVEFLDGWLALLEAAVRDAQEEGTIDPGEDAAQLAFEIEAALLLGNTQFVVARTPEPLERARQAIERRIASPV
jgi:AcrR family transcriptional regulator